MKDNIEDKKIGYPKWSKIMLSICLAINFPIWVIYTFFVLYNNNGISIFGFILLVFLLGMIWFLKYLFYSVTATSNGLITDNKFGRNKSFLWSEIIEVRRPRFNIPYEFTSVVSKNNDKLYLLKGMTHYKELIDLIKYKAPNLKKCQY